MKHFYSYLVGVLSIIFPAITAFITMRYYCTFSFFTSLGQECQIFEAVRALNAVLLVGLLVSSIIQFKRKNKNEAILNIRFFYIGVMLLLLSMLFASAPK